jgi:DNA-binding HxlR family transcriptional regulator
VARSGRSGKEHSHSAPFDTAVRILGAKWTLIIIHRLSVRPRRFGELRHSLGEVSSRILSDRLQLLESEGLVKRISYREVPPRVVYELTEAGRSVRPVLEALASWGKRHAQAGWNKARSK